MPVAGDHLAPGGRLTLAPASASRVGRPPVAGRSAGRLSRRAGRRRRAVARLSSSPTPCCTPGPRSRWRSSPGTGSGSKSPTAARCCPRPRTTWPTRPPAGDCCCWRRWRRPGASNRAPAGKVVWLELIPGERDSAVSVPDFSLAELDAWSDSGWPDEVEAPGLAGEAGGSGGRGRRRRPARG